ncbi:MAG: IS630 family transposase [Flavisolibacter sp.]|nr:IS630 family transposase [Flavisolibacter sp.]
MLHRHGWSKKAPRPEHPKAGEAKENREALKKAPALFKQLTTQTKPLKIFFEDEARFGRITGVCGCWVPKGKRAVVKKQIVREHSYAFCAVCPFEGESYRLISPVGNTQTMNELLHRLSEAYKEEESLLFCDSAGWHKSKALQPPTNIHPELLPPYSPELNATEHLWDYIREQKGFNNHNVHSRDELEDHLEKTLKELHQEKQYIQSLCTFHWMINTS